MPGIVSEDENRNPSTSQRIFHEPDPKSIKQRSEYLREMMEVEGNEENQRDG